MTRGLGRRSGAAVVLLTALLAVVPASPAGADPVITISQPGEGQTLDASSVTFTGSVSESSALNSLKDVTLAVGDKSKPVTCSGSPCPFSWTLSLPLNGPYQLKVTASDTVILVGGLGSTVDAVRKFKVAAPPAKPVLDPPRVNEARNVELSWTRNTEGDMLSYAVFRKDPAGGDPRQVPGGTVTQPASGAKVTFVDTTTSAFNGGTYAYLVVAVRKGADGTADPRVTSEASAAAAVTVPAPPTSTAAPLPPGSPAATPPGPTATAKPGQSAGVDLSGFLSSRSQPTPLAPITVPEAPDTGFAGTLPFGARPPGDDVEEGDAEAAPPGDVQRRSVVDRLPGGRPLVPIAGGLVLLLLALHMRLLNRRIKATPDTDLPVDAAAPAPPPPPPLAVRPLAAPAPEAPPPPPPALYDVVEEEDWDESWAPDAAELDIDLDDLPPAPDPEPVPEPVAAVEPEPEPEPEPEMEVVELWAPPDELDEDPLDEDALDDEVDDLDKVDEIEVFEVVSPTRRRLARAGSR